MIDMNLLALSIGIGLVVSLVFSELFGLAAGGLVVPGYIALFLHRPVDVALTLVAALVTFALVRLASTFVIIYGRRRTVMMVLVGYAVGVLMTRAISAGLDAALAGQTEEQALAVARLGAEAPAGALAAGLVEFGVIGFILPGLIAIWLDRQGVLATLSALLASAVVVRLILILVVPTEVVWLVAQHPSPWVLP